VDTTAEDVAVTDEDVVANLAIIYFPDVDVMRDAVEKGSMTGEKAKETLRGLRVTEEYRIVPNRSKDREGAEVWPSWPS
jgi:hypothetical protein